MKLIRVGSHILNISQLAFASISNGKLHLTFCVGEAFEGFSGSTVTLTGEEAIDVINWLNRHCGPLEFDPPTE